MQSKITLKEYKDGDFDAVSRLFFETVHTVNAKDYSREQLFAWASSPGCLEHKRGVFLEERTLIAEINGALAGFASIDDSGCLDMLYVSKNFLRQGVATALCDELEKGFKVIRTYASVTAKPFFEQRGYAAVYAQTVERGNVKLTNYAMEKTLLPTDG